MLSGSQAARRIHAELSAAPPRGRVEPGVTGKEKMFQQSREFGPGPIKPYPNVAPPRPRPTTKTLDGVYRAGGSRRTRGTITLRRGERLS